MRLKSEQAKNTINEKLKGNALLIIAISTEYIIAVMNCISKKSKLGL